MVPLCSKRLAFPRVLVVLHISEQLILDPLQNKGFQVLWHYFINILIQPQISLL